MGINHFESAKVLVTEFTPPARELGSLFLIVEDGHKVVTGMENTVLGKFVLRRIYFREKCLRG